MDQRIWTQITITVPSVMEDSIADFLTTLTGRGVCLREEGGSSVIDSYLEPEEAEDHLLRIEKQLSDLAEMGLLSENARLEAKELPEEDWMAVFRSQHTTVRISDRLVVRPTWCEPTTDHEVVLDPGLAFGTGSHPTTRMCMVLLDECIGDPVPGRMFDLGTGSGILAIAGAYLGIRDVLAADIDVMAVDVASGNVQYNRVDDHIRVVEGGVEAAEGLYDIITANISASLLARLAADISRHLRPGGKLVISGILEDELDDVTEAFTRCGLSVERVMREKVWIAALLVSPSESE
jgi:ribosomal protein L11 methyltransferase